MSNIDTQILELAKHLQKSVELSDTDAIKIASQMFLVKKQNDLMAVIKSLEKTIKEKKVKLDRIDMYNEINVPEEKVNFKRVIGWGNFSIGWIRD